MSVLFPLYREIIVAGQSRSQELTEKEKKRVLSTRLELLGSKELTFL